MKIGIIILTVLYSLVSLMSFLEILKGDIMEGIVGFIIAIGIYKLTKFLSWKPKYSKTGDEINEQRK